MTIICEGRMLLGTPHEENNSGSSIFIVDGELRVGDDESGAYHSVRLCLFGL